MKILIQSLNYSPEPVGIAVYSAGLAEELALRGHEVYVICGKPYYPQWQRYAAYKRFGWIAEQTSGISIIRCPHYVPARPSGIKRMIHHVTYAAAIVGPIAFIALKKRPRVIISIAPSIISAPVTRIAAKMAGAKSWLHVQDFEVEASFATGLISSNGIAARAALRFQNWILKSFDVVSAISPQMCSKLLGLGIQSSKVMEFRNWADSANITVIMRESIFRERWSITEPYVALYSGNIAYKQGMEILIDVARILSYREDIIFIICGEGPNLQRLKASAVGLSNIRFEPLQPLDLLNDLLGLATVHLLPQLKSAADLLLPSKLTNILASGRPVVVTADQDTSLAREVDGCGRITPPGEAMAFAKAISELISDPGARERYGLVARRRAEEKWSRDAILARLEKRLVELVDTGLPAGNETEPDESAPRR